MEQHLSQEPWPTNHHRHEMALSSVTLDLGNVATGEQVVIGRYDPREGVNSGVPFEITRIDEIPHPEGGKSARLVHFREMPKTGFAAAAAPESTPARTAEKPRPQPRADEEDFSERTFLEGGRGKRRPVQSTGFVGGPNVPGAAPTPDEFMPGQHTGPSQVDSWGPAPGSVRRNARRSTRQPRWRKQIEEE